MYLSHLHTIPCTEPTVLLNLLSKIKELQTDIRSSLRHAEGLLLRQVSLLKTARKIKQKYKYLVHTAASYSLQEPTGKRLREKVTILETAACWHQGCETPRMSIKCTSFGSANNSKYSICCQTGTYNR